MSSSQMVTMRMPLDLVAELRAVATQNDRSLSEEARVALRAWLQHYGERTMTFVSACPSGSYSLREHWRVQVISRGHHAFEQQGGDGFSEDVVLVHDKEGYIVAILSLDDLRNAIGVEL